MALVEAQKTRGTRRRSLGSSPEEAQILLKKAAETCVERHGVSKTTMEDIAKEVGVSRPTVYRYFPDREDLLLAVLLDRANALSERAYRYLSRHQSLAEQLVEGLLFLADHGRRDPFVRSDDARYMQRVLDSGVGANTAAAFWRPVLTQAAQRSELVDGLDHDVAYEWLAEVGLVVMRELDSPHDSPDRIRAKLRAFVVPAFVR